MFWLYSFNDLNVAKRLNDWNVWNGHQYSLAIERLERLELGAALMFPISI